MADPADWTDEFFDPLGDAGDEISIGQARRRLADARDTRNRTSRKRVKQTKKARKDRKARDERQAALRAQAEERRDREGREAADERRRRREGTESRFAEQQAYREDQAQYRQQRDAQRQAYREQRDRERDERREAANAAPMRFSSGTRGFAPEGAWNPDKEAVAKFIIFVTALGAIAGVANDLTQNTQPIKMPNGTKIPAHLRTLGGTFIAGTIALIVNEVYPAAGAVLGAGIVGVIVIPNMTQLIPKLGGFFAGGGAGKVGGGGVAGGNEKFDPSTGLITGDRGTYRLVPVGGGNYSIEPAGPPRGTTVI